MPSVLSTLKDEAFGREWSFPYNCYEIGHGWTPFCSGAAIEVGSAAFKNSLPLYSSLYLFTQLGLQRKVDLNSFLETFKSIVTSASFLGFNFFAGIGVSCLARNYTDRYYYRLQCLLPGFIASYLALLIERPSRRPALAFYLANMSSELLYKSFESKGYIKSLPHGETALFSLGMACWLRFVRIHGFGHDPVSSVVKYLIGPQEAMSRARIRTVEHKTDGDQQPQALATQSKKPRKSKTPSKIERAITESLNAVFSCHELCPHKGMSCVDYSLTPAISRFAMGYLIRSVLNLASGFRIIRKEPLQTLKQAFTAQSSLNFGLFLGTFVGTAKGTHCIMRRITGKQEDWHSAVAGGLSGFSMLYSPKSTLSTYIVWKCLEQYFFLGVQNGTIRRPNEVICLTYAISVNVLLYIFALEPRFIRPSYMKFIDRITDHRLHQVNRMVLDVFGTGASVGYEDWFPNLDPNHMSRQFRELIFNWLIQPYE